jgi:hypothetical protein
MGYTIVYGATTLPLLDWNITYKTNELDVAVVDVITPITTTSIVIIYQDTTPIFYGYVKACESMDSGTHYKITIQEKACEMLNVIMNNGSSYTYAIPISTVSTVITGVLTQVNTAFGYSGGNAWTLATTDTTATPLMGMYYTNALSVINKLTIEQLKYVLWFDSSAKTVNFGTYRTDRSATNIAYISSDYDKDTYKRGVTKVIVIGKDGSIIGTAGTGNNARCFSYPSSSSSAECAKLATNLLADFSVERNRINITTNAGSGVYAGDKIKFNNVVYTVFDVTRNISQDVIGVGYTQTTLLQQLGADITEISGETVSGTDAQWNGGTQNVGTTSAIFNVDIKDVNMISSFVLKTNIGAYRKTVTTPSSTNYLSDVTPLLTTILNTTTDNISAGESNYYPYDGTNRYLLGNGWSNGYQNALFTITLDMISGSATNDQYVIIRPQYSLNGSTWYTISDGSVNYEQKVMFSTYGSTRNHAHTTISMLIPGSSTSSSLYTRCLITSYSDATVSIAAHTAMLQVVQRHLHSVPVQTDDTGDVGSAPYNVILRSVNTSSLGGSMTDGATYDITSYLINGKNTILYEATSVANKGSITPTATYQTLGKS